MGFSLNKDDRHRLTETPRHLARHWDRLDPSVSRYVPVYPRVRKIRGEPAIPNEAELNSIRNCPQKLAKIRA